MPSLATRIRGPVAVIGDVHGQVEKLSAVLEQLFELPDFESRWLVFIGDLVDRGPDPKGAIDLILDVIAQHDRTTIVAGNHELAMSAALEIVPSPDYSNWGERWIKHYGAEATFESYGAPFGNLKALKTCVPDSHKQLLAALPWCVEHPAAFFVHAGLDPNTPFEMQMRILRQKDYSLNRPQWLCSKTLVEADPPPDCPIPVVSGHVCVPEVSFQKRRILVDTTGGADGRLSCALLPERVVVTSDGLEPVTVGETRSTRAWWKIWN